MHLSSKSKRKRDYVILDFDTKLGVSLIENIVSISGVSRKAHVWGQRVLRKEINQNLKSLDVSIWWKILLGLGFLLFLTGFGLYFYLKPYNFILVLGSIFLLTVYCKFHRDNKHRGDVFFKKANVKMKLRTSEELELHPVWKKIENPDNKNEKKIEVCPFLLIRSKHSKMTPHMFLQGETSIYVDSLKVKKSQIKVEALPKPGKSVGKIIIEKPVELNIETEVKAKSKVEKKVHFRDTSNVKFTSIPLQLETLAHEAIVMKKIVGMTEIESENFIIDSSEEDNVVKNETECSVEKNELKIKSEDPTLSDSHFRSKIQESKQMNELSISVPVQNLLENPFKRHFKNGN